MLSHFGHVQLFVTSWTVCSPPGSFIRGILRARILGWISMPTTRGSSQLRDRTPVSRSLCIAGRFFTTEPPEAPKKVEGWGREATVVQFYSYSIVRYMEMGFPGFTSGKEPACQCRRIKRRGFDLWVWKIPWKRAWQPLSIFLPGEPPWTEEPGGLQPIELQRVGPDCSDSMPAFTWKYLELRIFLSFFFFFFNKKEKQ